MKQEKWAERLEKVAFFFIKIRNKSQKTKKPAGIQRVSVVLGRIELPTHGFSVHCSTI